MKIKIMGSFRQSCPAHQNLEPGLLFAVPNPLAAIPPLRPIPRPRERERVAEGRVRATGEKLNNAERAGALVSEANASSCVVHSWASSLQPRHEALIQLVHG